MKLNNSIMHTNTVVRPLSLICVYSWHFLPFFSPKGLFLIFLNTPFSSSSFFMNYIILENEAEVSLKDKLEFFEQTP